MKCNSCVRCLMRYEPYLASILQRTSGLIHYQTSAKTDANLTSRLLGAYEEAVPVTEKDDYQLDLSNNLFLEYRVRFESVAFGRFINLLSEDLRGYIRFKFEGKTYKGFVLKAGEAPVNNQPQEWELRLHPETPFLLSYEPFFMTGKYSQRVDL
ncbi:MAG: hypothetical protein LBL90_00725 [Prevotellaceae bacterium]|nr:hypothetical protein [Prevotellaceae bacterium]